MGAFTATATAHVREDIRTHLALHAGQTFTKEQIYEAVFGIDGTADDLSLIHI